MSNPTKIITRYLQFQYEKDLQENVFLTYNTNFYQLSNDEGFQGVNPIVNA